MKLVDVKTKRIFTVELDEMQVLQLAVALGMLSPKEVKDEAVISYDFQDFTYDEKLYDNLIKLLSR